MDVSRDLDIAIHGDLKRVDFDLRCFDVIYCCHVLEHVTNVQEVLFNFKKWIKAGEIIILRFPDRNSAFGFLTRKLPFWIHVIRSRLTGNPNAGKPGYGPYPTVYDPILCREGIHEFCRTEGLKILHEYGTRTKITRTNLAYVLTTLEFRILWVVSQLSARRLAHRHSGLIYLIERT